MKKIVFIVFFAICFLFPNPIYSNDIFLSYQAGVLLSQNHKFKVTPKKDNFAIIDNLNILGEDTQNNRVENNIESKKDLTYLHFKTELPLFKEDYYQGKYENALATAQEINTIPALKPGDTIKLLDDNFITLNLSKGYIQPENGFYYGSGACWSTSALGQLMDKANNYFVSKFNTPLFIFPKNGRAPHSDWYKTYEYSNNSYGYTIFKSSVSEGQDFIFTVNPKLKEIPQFNDLKIKIVLEGTKSSPKAYSGQSINGYLLLNSNLKLVEFTPVKNQINYFLLDFETYLQNLKQTKNSL